MSDNAAALYLENQLCFPLYAASRMTTKIYAPLLKALDLTYPQYLVMLVLWQHGKQTVNQIGSRLYLESNTLTPLLKRLEQKGLISRRRSSQDERSVLVQLTETGAQLKAEAEEIPKTIIESFNDSRLTELEVLQFQKTLFKLVEILSERAERDKE
ncbi:MarR family transcriptional regulator [Phaeodactylibacter sp.]|uniref:MarR family winged helix-turn-helix transcriptional regulator n=1 Tax=Phaeodactylibacter sp. TaxID=1940289 RepID=UPI0025E3B4D3|nr:MarR family transcriptional regulator [Phaeodactylibacter sp.]MCI4651175.1 MarR family transcriptional regulator [Phaeodactylibacter sp.]MCI5090468.1 MarR family transcriptional regulator [Phaeodactylibacter sp.]